MHSAKDVPGELADGLELAGAPAREDPRDALCGAARRSRSCRRARASARAACAARAQLLALREDLDVARRCAATSTRACARLAAGDFDAIVLALRRAAAARPRRLERRSTSSSRRPGQGTLAIEARAGDERVAAAIAALRDSAAERALHAERALVARARRGLRHADRRARPRRSATASLELRAFVGAPDGSAWIRDRAVRRRPDRRSARRRASGCCACGAGALRVMGSGRVAFVGAGPGDPGC